MYPSFLCRKALCEELVSLEVRLVNDKPVQLYFEQLACSYSIPACHTLAYHHRRSHHRRCPDCQTCRLEDHLVVMMGHYSAEAVKVAAYCL